MKQRVVDLGIDVKEAYTPLDRRYAERASLRIPVLYASADGSSLLKAEGLLTDLSKSGCNIEGTVSPPVGSRITLFLYLADGQPPLCLTDVTIPRVKGLAFAAEFPDLMPEERKRIQQLIWRHVTFSASRQTRAGFRIV
ncbi:protein of unknown function [Nitrospira japonica]|uniref:PilZ domain-containing protein n=1 Tax=Nitrospira japonica TaxID=1325564 RepID=A0A1W1I4L6_9BACT|nr:PilZ domain-containing protein [Nitrospira japonica]SLM47881.1 protein of unknown function [Nitrospira japonica]